MIIKYKISIFLLNYLFYTRTEYSVDFRKYYFNKLDHS